MIEILMDGRYNQGIEPSELVIQYSNADELILGTSAISSGVNIVSDQNILLGLQRNNFHKLH